MYPSLKPISPSFSVCAKWRPCTLRPVHPLHCGPSRLLLKVLSFNHFFKKAFFSRAVWGHRSHQSCFPTQWPFNQAEVHFEATLFRPPFLPGAQGWSLWPQSSESHSYQSFRGDWVTYTNSPGFTAWLSVPYSYIDSPEMFLLTSDPSRCGPTQKKIVQSDFNVSEVFKLEVHWFTVLFKKVWAVKFRWGFFLRILAIIVLIYSIK